MNETLKPCPFCGASPRPITSSEMLTWCVNQKCRLRGMGFSKEEWNTRPSDAVMEAARKVADEYRKFTGVSMRLPTDLLKTVRALAALLKESPVKENQ